MRCDATSYVLEPRLRKLGLPVGRGHVLEQAQDRGIFLLKNGADVAYLLVAASESKALDKLCAALEGSKSVSAAIAVNEDGNVTTVLRKSFRTGDIDRATAFEKPTSEQAGFQFQSGGPRSLRPLNDRLENGLCCTNRPQVRRRALEAVSYATR